MPKKSTTAATTKATTKGKAQKGATKKLSAYNVFMASEIKAIKAAGEKDHRMAFKKAAANWKAKKEGQ